MYLPLESQLPLSWLSLVPIYIGANDQGYSRVPLPFAILYLMASYLYDLLNAL